MEEKRSQIDREIRDLKLEVGHKLSTTELILIEILKELKYSNEAAYSIQNMLMNIEGCQYSCPYS